MSNLVNVPKNGSLANINSKLSFPNLLEDLFTKDLPSVFTSNLNTGFSLPKVNIKETADAFIIDMAVLGLKKSDFQICVDNQILSVSTKTEQDDKKVEDNYTYREFNYSSFKRTFKVPESVNKEKINAKYEDGILSIVLPKKDEAKPKPAKVIKVS